MMEQAEVTQDSNPIGPKEKPRKVLLKVLMGAQPAFWEGQHYRVLEEAIETLFKAGPDQPHVGPAGLTLLMQTVEFSSGEIEARMRLDYPLVERSTLKRDRELVNWLTELMPSGYLDKGATLQEQMELWIHDLNRIAGCAGSYFSENKLPDEVAEKARRATAFDMLADAASRYIHAAMPVNVDAAPKGSQED